MVKICRRRKEQRGLPRFSSSARPFPFPAAQSFSFDIISAGVNNADASVLLSVVFAEEWIKESRRGVWLRLPADKTRFVPIAIAVRAHLSTYMKYFDIRNIPL